MEKEILHEWYGTGLVDKYLHKNDQSKTKFVFYDGPITANNPMGVHHAWGRTYKDLWQRFHTMRGDKQRYQNGFDCQGLWVEVEVEKELGFKTKKDIEVYGVAEFVNQCKQRVLKYSSIQTEQSKRLGYFMDWDNSYFTMSDENNYTIWHALKVCYDRGWIYKGHDSVPWCPRCETAISQHEMLTEDYKEITHQSIIMEFPLIDRDHEFLLVWTTTPWTIPANIAVAVDENADYSLVEGNPDPQYKHWVATPLVNSIFDGKPGKVIRTVKGKELVGMKYRSAFDGLEAVEKARQENPDKFHSVVPTDNQLLPISMTEGTGMVHTAVSAGEEDFKLGKKLGLPMIPIIADNADYLGGFGEFSGKNAKKHPEVILDYLQSREEQDKSWVFKIFPYTHRYPACWRCKTELVWKVADEWYISMDKADPSDTKKRTLRQQLVDVTKEINWLPSFGLDRELDWLKNMHDWLISKKNRYWGLALPIYECKKCGHFEVLDGKEDLKERAISGWEKFEGNTPHRPWIDEVKIKCSKCGETVSRILDVGNPWLDAGIIPFSTLHYSQDRSYWQQWFPADFITESFPGQFKNWFYSLLVMGTILEKTNSFKNVLGYGSLLAEDGRPMHKSWGNAIEFNEGADKIGVDVMRWLYARSNPSDNLLFGYKKADEVRRQFMLILWNSYNFFVSYALLDNWTPSKTITTPSVLDQWILARLSETVHSVTEGLLHFDAQVGALAIESLVSDFSLWYIRRSRDRVGPSAENKQDKQAFYSTGYDVLVTLSKLLAPFMPFVSEEMYRNLTGEESVHLADWPKIANKTPDTDLLEKMQFVRKVVELAHAQRKALSIKVRQPLAAVQVTASPYTLAELTPFLTLITDELNVKGVSLDSGDGELTVQLDTNLTPELEAEGQAREIVRQIQDARKALGTVLDEKVTVTLPDWPNEFEDYIKKQTLASKLVQGDLLRIERVK